ncbi:MAG: LPS export ABC transporter permease LptG [Planctomycetota bacterium]|nr:MAG: LPS export ABC transporter permease LptG [Planctomycetota bacterium]
MDRLDRYVARVFFSSWVLSVVFFTGLYGVYDVFAHFDDLIEDFGGSDSGFGAAVRYYLYQAPGMVLKVAPFIMVMSALVAVMRLKRHNELLAMVLVGRPARRVLRPIFMLTGVFVLVLLFLQEVVTPAVALERDKLYNSLIENREEWVIENVKLRDHEGRLFIAHDYDVNAQRIARLTISFEDRDGRRVSIQGTDAVPDVEGGGWRLLGGGLQTVSGNPRFAPAEDEIDFVPTDIRHEDMMSSLAEPHDLAFAELRDLARRYPNARKYKLFLHYHITHPLSVLLLVLLAVPWMLDWMPGRNLRGLAAAIGICLGFMLLDALVLDRGKRGFLQPVLAAWLPVIVAGSLAIVLFDSKER